MTQFPAIVIGGPPHSGKSVLTYGLTQALRRRQVDHYVLRACPDGEGDWSNESPPETVRLIRNKGQFTTAFVEQVCQALRHRHLPLLVDVGGRPTPEQEAIFDHCTHAILLAAQQEDLITWRRLTTAHHLTILAELQSSLTEPEVLTATEPIIRGRISRLERNSMPQGKVFEQLVNYLTTLLHYDPAQLRTLHLDAAPAEITVELDRLGKSLGIPADQPWRPHDLSAVLHYLPARTPLAIYGRGPGWLYAALANHIYPAPLFQFDARLGWVQPPPLQIAPTVNTRPLIFDTQTGPNYTYLEMKLANSYLDYSECAGLTIPTLAADQGIVFSGKLPHWLLTGLIQAYQSAAWLAVYQPQLDGQAVTVASLRSPYPPGHLHSLVGITLSSHLPS